MTDLKNMEEMKESILKDSPRLGPEDTFYFACHKDLPCFNECCCDVNIVLTPYDVIRMKQALGISSDEFLEKYALVASTASQKLPIVMMRLGDDDKKQCQFVGENGCRIYNDRPWACRTYPVGVASPTDEEKQGERFYFFLREDVCMGFGEKKQWTIREWLRDQGSEEFDKLGEMFKEINLHEHFLQGGTLEPAKLEMLHMVCYNVDKFRRFVFESKFLERFVVDDDTVEKIRKDDVELLKFGFKWLKFALFGETTLTIRDPDKEKSKLGGAPGGRRSHYESKE
jgi:Fe-S-cluster containining protein